MRTVITRHKRVVDGATFDPAKMEMLATYDQTDTEGAELHRPQSQQGSLSLL